MIVSNECDAPAGLERRIASCRPWSAPLRCEFLIVSHDGAKVEDRPAVVASRAVNFGPFRLLAAQQSLLEHGKPVRLGGRALDILTVLIERHSEVVTKEQLITRVWPTTFVEEGNLRVHIAALRKALGDGQAGRRYIANIPGRGYQFVAPVSYDDEAGAAEPAAPAPAHNLPAPLSRMLGRADVVRSLVDELGQRRFLTLVGPGGIGKTTVALAVADAKGPSLRNGARFLDLTTTTDPARLPASLASVLGFAVRPDDPVQSLISYLRDKDILLVLDSCEHAIETAAALAEKLLRGAPGVRILATSREPLRADGERVRRLAPLGVPAASAGITADKALAYPGVQLFVERASVSLDGFELTDADAPIVAEVCRRLDGIPLAIELAAARVDTFGVKGLVSVLTDRLRLAMKGRRTALPRHQTLAATLDWSHASLSEDERVLLRRLSIFAGPFSAEAAYAVAGGEEDDKPDIIDRLANLVAKSLVAADVVGAGPRYHLLETTRAYAHQKLVESGEAETVARRHAEYCRDLLATAQLELHGLPAAVWLAAYGSQIDNVRKALDWAFSATGDKEIGIAIAVTAVPLWMQMSLMSECRTNVERGLAYLGANFPDNSEMRMRLYAALSLSLMYTAASGREVDAAWTTTLALAEERGDADYQLRAVWGLFAGAINTSGFVKALELAKRFRALASDVNEQLIGERIIGVALHFLGDQAGAREHTERMLNQYVAPEHADHMIRFQNNQYVAARRVLAPVLWLQGYPDQAMRAAEQAVVDSVAIDHALSLCNNLAQSACPLALLTGNLPAAERYIALLLDNSERYALDIWHAYGRGFRGILMMKHGDLQGGLPLLSAAASDLRRAEFTQFYTPFLSVVANALAITGRAAQGLVAIDEALARSEVTSERWTFAELLRVKGEVLLRHDTADSAHGAEDMFRRSLDWARRQGALSWELRTANSLARHMKRSRRHAEARALVAPVFARFSEGFATEDLMTAKSILAG